MTVQRHGENVERFVGAIKDFPCDHFDWRELGRTIGLTPRQSDEVAEELGEHRWFWPIARGSIARIDRDGFNVWYSQTTASAEA
jgi:hypothetical protein